MRKVIVCCGVMSVALLLGGCAGLNSPEPFTPSNAYQMRNKIIVGSRQDDSRVVYSVGKVQKVWVAPYTQGGTMVASHDNFVVTEKPHFIAGESVDKAGTGPVAVSPSRQLPYAYRDSELDKTSTAKQFTNRSIKKFNNNIYKSRRAHNIPVKKRIKKATKRYDKRIFQFLGRS